MTEKEKISLAHWEGYVEGRRFGWNSAIIEAAQIAKEGPTGLYQEKQILELLEKFK